MYQDVEAAQKSLTMSSTMAFTAAKSAHQNAG
jgi:hypothetical protein